MDRTIVAMNLLTFGVNELLERGVISLHPDQAVGNGYFPCNYPDGEPCLVQHRDIGHGEIQVDVIYKPKSNKPRIYWPNASFRQYANAHAAGYLDRARGTYIMDKPGLSCSREAMQHLKCLVVEPRFPFAKGGKFYF